MTDYPSSRVDAERTIAAGRVVLAAASLFAVWMDPAEPARFAQTTYLLHWIYMGYAALLVAVTWQWRGASALPIVAHVIDILASSVFQYLTLGPSSPFFIYFVYALFCAAIRWGWRGTLATASVVIAAYLILSTTMNETLGPVEDGLNRLIVRTVYLLVVAGMLVYLGRHEAGLRQKLERLAHWPSPTNADLESMVRRLVGHAAGILNAGRAVIVWEVGEEPATHMASWSPDGLALLRFAPESVTPLLPEALASSTFLSAGPVGTNSTILVNDPDRGLVEREGLPLHPQLLDLLGGEGLASAPFHTERVTGRVFFTDLGAPPNEIVPLTDVVAHEIGASLDQMHITRQLQDLATSEERIRLARDLHDGVLQSLTGIRFELRALERAFHEGDESVGGRLHALERALAMEQRELRFFIGDLKPTSAVRAQPPSSLIGRLDGLRERLALEWNTPVTIQISPVAQESPAALVQAVPLMVHEAVVNALKHARPSHVAVTVDADARQLRIVVHDNGCGFAFMGRYDHAALTASNQAPRSLLDRVTALGGTMSIDSSPEGSQVEMVLAL